MPKRKFSAAREARRDYNYKRQMTSTRNGVRKFSKAYNDNRQPRSYTSVGRGYELKLLDSTQTQVPIAIAGDTMFDTLLTIPAGTSPEERIGRKVTLKQMYIRGFIDMDNDIEVASTYSPNFAEYVRVAVVQDTQPNGAAATYDTVWEPTTTAEQGCNAFRSINNSKRFKILYSKLLRVTSIICNSSTADSFTRIGGRTAVKINLPKLNIPLIYSSTLGVVGERTENNVLVFMATTNNDVDCGFNGIARIRYTDM